MVDCSQLGFFICEGRPSGKDLRKFLCVNSLASPEKEQPRPVLGIFKSLSSLAFRLGYVKAKFGWFRQKSQEILHSKLEKILGMTLKISKKTSCCRFVAAYSRGVNRIFYRLSQSYKNNEISSQILKANATNLKEDLYETLPGIPKKVPCAFNATQKNWYSVC